MIDIEKYTFSAALPKAIETFSDHKAMGFLDEGYITYKELGHKIAAVKAFIEKMNIKPGDKVAIYSQNMPNWGITYFALQCMGIVAVPVLPDFNAHELQNVLTHSEAKAMFISESLEYKFADVDKKSIELVVRLDDFKVLQGASESIVFDENAECVDSYDADENALAILLYTSGTTGDSKGVMLSQKNVIMNARQADGIQPIPVDWRFLSVLPLSHTYENTLGLILPILAGANITYLRKPPTASVLVPAMKSVKPHLMLTVPMIIEKVYKNSVLPGIKKKGFTRALYNFKPTRKLVHYLAGKKLYETFGGNLKFFGVGGAKLDGTVEQFLRDAKFPYAIGYGLTETAPMLAGSNPSMTKLQSIGPKVFDVELKINNPDPKTGEGEVWARGPQVMLGYYKNEEKTKEVLTDDGWFKTGDLAVFDKDGWLMHKGRSKNMIVGANGENIYPEEIESVINNFKHVVESIVVEKKGKLVAMVHFNRDEMEQRVKERYAELALKMEDKIEEMTSKYDELMDELAAELQAYVNERVNKFSRVQLVVAHPDPFQKTATLKIKRYLYY